MAVLLDCWGLISQKRFRVGAYLREGAYLAAAKNVTSSTLSRYLRLVSMRKQQICYGIYRFRGNIQA